MRISRISLAITLLAFICESSQAQSALELTKSMFLTVKNAHTLRYTAESNERVNGKLRFESSNFKLQDLPFKIYIYQNIPKKGIECLWVTGKFNGKVKVNPGSFPWVTLNLQPDGDLMLGFESDEFKVIR